MSKHPCVYILASERYGTPYIGVTSDLVRRIWQYRNEVAEGFTNKYRVHRLAWFEQHETMESAITARRQSRDGGAIAKLNLIESANPTWRDLYDDVVQ